MKTAKLAPNERKKITSKKNGKWLNFCGQDKWIYGALVEIDDSEWLVYSFL